MMRIVLRGRAASFAAVIALFTNLGFTAPLTLNDALRIFRARGFDLLIADASIAAAAGDVTIAQSIANPSLSLTRGTTFNYNPSLCAGCSSASISGGVTDQAAISDALTGKRRLRIAVARAALGATRSSRADVERTLEFTVKQQMLQAELAKQSLAYARESQQIASDTLDLVNTRYAAGAVSEADDARAEVQKLEADQAVDSARQLLDSARAGLAYLLGYKETPSDLDVAGDLTHSAAITVPGSAVLLQEALAHRPDLAAARFQIERAQSSLSLTKRQRAPDVFPSANYSQEGTGQSAIQPPTITFGLSFTPPVFYSYRGEIAKAEADLRTQQVTAQKIEAEVGSDVSTAVAAFIGAHSRTARMEGRLLDRAARSRDLVRLQYEKGAVSLFEFLDAERTYVATRNEYLQNLNDYWTAVFQLEQATGTEMHP